MFCVVLLFQVQNSKFRESRYYLDLSSLDRKIVFQRQQLISWITVPANKRCRAGLSVLRQIDKTSQLTEGEIVAAEVRGVGVGGEEVGTK